MADKGTSKASKTRLHPEDKQEELYEASSSVLFRYLKTHQMRSTQERLIVLRQVCTYRDTFTAEQLLQDMPTAIPISTATVYNTLNLLCDCHILQRRQLPANNRIYEYVTMISRESFMQFVCIHCGRIVKFHDKAIETILKERPFNNFNPSYYSLCVYGECKVCRKKMNQG